MQSGELYKLKASLPPRPAPIFKAATQPAKSAGMTFSTLPATDDEAAASPGAE